MYYRADKRVFVVGDTIHTAGQFTQKNPTQEEKLGESVESIFERLRPKCAPPRASSLFLFTDLRAAQWHWSKMTGGILYEASVSIEVTFTGDMKWVDEAGKSASVGQVEVIAKHYWDELRTPKPVLEVLVPSAAITKVVSDNQVDRQSMLKEFYRGNIPIP